MLKQLFNLGCHDNGAGSDDENDEWKTRVAVF